MLQLPTKPTLFVVLLLGVNLYSQVPSQVDQSRVVDSVNYQNASDLNLRPVQAEYAVAPSSSGDTDLGEQRLLKEKEKKAPSFSVYGNVSGYWTDNVALAKNAEQSDRFVVGSVGVSYAPHLDARWSADVTVKQQFFRYDTFNALDFNSTNAGAGASYTALELGGVSFFGRYNFNLLTTGKASTGHSEFSEFYRNQTVSVGVQRAFPLSRAHYLFVGESNQFGFSHPKEAQRNEYGVYAGYHLDLTRRLETNAYYKVSLFDYGYNERSDLNQILSLGMAYHFTQWCTVGGDISFNWNNSNQPVFDYESVTPSGGLTLSLSF